MSVSAAFKIWAGVNGAFAAVANLLQSSIYLKIIEIDRCGSTGCVSFAVLFLIWFGVILP